MKVMQENIPADNHALRQYYYALDFLPVYVTKVDMNMSVTWANKYATDTDEDIVGKYCFDNVNNAKEQCTFCPVKRAMVSKMVEVSLVDVIKNDCERIYEITAIPYIGEHGVITGVFEIRKDVTLQLDYQKIKNELKQVNKGEKSKDVFDNSIIIDIVSEELKELLNDTIKINNKASEVKNEKEYNLRSISLSTNLSRMNSILNNVQVMRDINAGKLKTLKKKNDLKDIVMERFTYYQYKHNIDGNNFDYKYDYNIPSKLILDKMKVELILTNLIDYAMNNSSNKFVNLLITMLDQSYDSIKLSLEIKNIGSIQIHDAVEEDIDKYLSNNLALNVIKNLVSNLKGNLKIEPISGYGVTITIILEFKKIFTPSRVLALPKMLFTNRDKKNKNVNKAKKYKILIAEDEAIGRITMEQMLKNEYDITFAKNGKIAVEKFLSESPDLIIMDIMMPIMNGFDAYDQIRRNSIEKISIIACTAKVINSEREYLKSYGFDDYIAKPINMKILKDIIKKHLPED